MISGGIEVDQFAQVSLIFFLFVFAFTNIYVSQDNRGRGGYFFNSSLPLPLALQALRY